MKKNTTVQFYEDNAKEFCEKHDNVRLNSFHETFRTLVKPGSKVLEIGSGSGRDAVLMLDFGYNVYILDGAKNLLEEAQILHPELKGRAIHCVLPDKIPAEDASYDAFYSIACLMHLTTEELNKAIPEIARVLRTGAKGLISLPASRPGLNRDMLDDKNRLMNILTPTGWQKLFTSHGFTIRIGDEEPDKMGREGVTWRNFTLIKQ